MITEQGTPAEKGPKMSRFDVGKRESIVNHCVILRPFPIGVSVVSDSGQRVYRRDK